MIAFFISGGPTLFMPEEAGQAVWAAEAEVRGPVHDQRYPEYGAFAAQVKLPPVKGPGQAPFDSIRGAYHEAVAVATAVCSHGESLVTGASCCTITDSPPVRHVESRRRQLEAAQALGWDHIRIIRAKLDGSEARASSS